MVKGRKTRKDMFMKLAYVCPWFSLEYKGPLYNLLNEISKHIDVVCICSRQKYVQYFKRGEKHKGDTEFINPHFKIHRFRSVAPRDITVPFGIYEILEAEKPDIVQSDEFFRLTTLKAAKWCRRNRVPLIINFRLVRLGGFARRNAYRFFSWLARSAVKYSKRIVCITSKAKKVGLRFFPKVEKKMVVIPTGIDIRKMQGGKAQKFRKRFRVPKNKEIVMHIGRIYPIKRIDLLLKAFAILKKKRQNALLVVVGPRHKGEWTKVRGVQQELGLKDREDVIFTGPIPNEQVRDALDACDVFVLTSETEVLGYVLLEAMSQKKPVVAFGVDGILDVIKSGKNGFLVKFNDIKSFASKIEILLKNKRLRERLGSGGLKTVKQKFNLAKIVERLIKIYKDSLYE